MAQQEDFIKAIAPYCIKYAKQYGFKVASPAIAQACLESGYGTSSKAKHHNYFGLKYRANRLTVNNGIFIDESSEQKLDGSYVPITDQWFNFDTMEKGVEGYFQFINIANYSKVKTANTPLQYLQEIKNAGYATSINYVTNVNNVINKWNLSKYDKEMEGVTKMSNSSLIDYTIKSPNHSGARTHTIDRISPHCVVGQLSAESIGGCFTSSSRQASCNYGIGKDGRVVLVVDEANRSWCTSSNANDQRAVTIECASDSTAPYAFNNVVYNKLIDLCTDICKRNGKKKLLWFADKNTALNYNPKADEMVLTVHRWFANKSCPGDWMYERMGDLANKVNAKLGSGTVTTPTSTAPTTATNKNYPAVPFTVKVIVSDLNIRKTPNGAITGKCTGKGTFTIDQVQNGWGHLKSNAGWIYLENTSYVTIGKTVAGGSSTASSTVTSASYLVKVTANALNIRKGPGTNYGTNGTITNKGTYTIIETQGNWGKLKSGAGWICLDYTKRV